MKVGIYSKWLETLGGGEKVATVMAEILSKKGHKVDILSTFKVNKAIVESRMGVNLNKVEFIPLQERSYSKIFPITKKYDLFINVSFLDHQPCGAKRSIYYTLFPTPVTRTFLGFIKYEAILPFLRQLLVIPVVSKGLNEVGDVATRAGKWLEEENTIILQNPPREFNIRFRIYCGSITLRTLDDIVFEIRNAKASLIDRKIDHHTSTLDYRYKIQSFDSSSVVLNIKVGNRLKKIGAALVSMTVDDIRYLIWNIVKKFMPRYEMALYGSANYNIADGINSYNLFLADSLYTKKWTYRFWGKKSRLLYPPVDVNKFKPALHKKNIILSVGRFFVGGHSKRQDILIQAFKEMVDSNSDGSNPWELHLVGGVASGWEHNNYVKSLETLAKDYPIFFHYSVDFKELKRLYSTAKIYWHAAGFGQNELRNAIAMEHFGISTIEAMAAGCVPIVFKGGGLIETVGSVKELLWKNIPQLKKITTEIINNERKRTKLSHYFRELSRDYSRKNFENNFIKIVNKINEQT